MLAQSDDETGARRESRALDCNSGIIQPFSQKRPFCATGTGISLQAKAALGIWGPGPEPLMPRLKYVRHPALPFHIESDRVLPHQNATPEKYSATVPSSTTPGTTTSGLSIALMHRWSV